MPDHTRLKGISEYGQYQLSAALQVNLNHYLCWAFLGIGAFANVERSSASASGAYGGDLSRLRLSEDPNYSVGQVWDGVRRDWVWETGIDYGTQPIHVSGVWVNSTFHPSSSSGAYAHTVDYPNGRIVFQNPISSGATVQASYSFRAVHVADADSPWWRQFQSDSLRADNPHFLQYGSGDWSVLPQNRIQLPAIVVDAIPETRSEGAGLGGGQHVSQRVHLYVVGQLPGECKHLHDILVRQKEKRLNLYDLDRVSSSGVYPLNADGDLNPSGLMYPQLLHADGYGWRQMRVTEATSRPIPRDEAGGLYPAVVEWTCEVTLP